MASILRCFLVSGLGFLGLASMSRADLRDELAQASPVVAVVNEEPLSHQALLHWMQKDRHEVARYFFREHDVRPGPDFWSPATAFEGESPFQMLAKPALSKAISTQVLLQLAEANGIIRGTDHGAALQRHRSHEEARTQKLRQRQVVYGPKQFNAVPFFDHFLALVKIELEGLLASDRIQFPAWAKVNPALEEAGSVEGLIELLEAQSRVEILLQS